MSIMKFEYHNRDLSWLKFNHRVLEQAMDRSLPLYERIQFLAIYSNNLEEFYRVRISYYRRLIENLSLDNEKYMLVNPEAVMLQINEKVSLYQKEFEDVFNTSIMPELQDNGIKIIDSNYDITDEQRTYLSNYFHDYLLPNLMPVVLHNKRIRPFLKTGQIYIAIKMTVKKGIRNYYGLLNVPKSNPVTRFVELPSRNNEHYIMFLEDVIMSFAYILYPGYKIKDWFSIKTTRDADLDYDELEGEELIKRVDTITTNRQVGEPNRFQVDRLMPQSMLEYICDSFGVDMDSIVKGGRHQNFRDFFSFPNPLSPNLEGPKHIPARVYALEKAKSLIRLFKKDDFLLHFPYQSYDYFIQFLNEAALADDVMEIKATQYRVAKKSAVVDALINAALHGKKVTVFVELKARFDEENNLRYAREMKSAGINIIYSIPGLKVHSKIAIVIRKPKEDGERKKICFLGTGNFNENTARLYCDHGLFTADPNITREVNSLFNYLEDQKIRPVFKHILVPTFNMVEAYKSFIDSEISAAKNGNKAYVFIKANGLDDPAMIAKLYEASLAGVKVDCVIRSACCLKTNQPYSKNIRVIRLVDKFLEHARVFMFYAGGEKKIYIGSGDWMKRNLYRRIECVYPIYNQNFKKELEDIYTLQMSDTVKGVFIDENMDNIPRTNEPHKIRSQEAIYEYLKGKHSVKEDGPDDDCV